MKQLFLNFHRDQRATGLVEFALCLVVTLTAIFGVMAVSGSMFIDHIVVSSARQGARYASVRGSNFTGVSCATVTSSSCAASAANVSTYVQYIAFPGGAGSPRLTATATWPGTDGSGYLCTNSVRPINSFGCLVTVKVAYSYEFDLPFLPHKTFIMTSTSSQTISQ
jgi:Flp pilus assembly protein TadG